MNTLLQWAAKEGFPVVVALTLMLAGSLIGQTPNAQSVLLRIQRLERLALKDDVFSPLVITQTRDDAWKFSLIGCPQTLTFSRKFRASKPPDHQIITAGMKLTDLCAGQFHPAGGVSRPFRKFALQEGK